MKKNYQKPACTVVKLNSEELMRQPLATSIQNIHGHIQMGITTNEDQDFEAGAKEEKGWNLWDKE